MYDIKFFEKTKELKDSIIRNDYSKDHRRYLYEEFEKLRNNKVHIFNLETTNNCNMSCIMCPRTSAMTRDITTIDDNEFENVIQQIHPHSKEDIEHFWKFIEGEYGINELSRSENAFYFYVSSRCLTLHGYGEPLVDPNILDRVKLCKEYGVPTYFSCVPANIDVVKITNLMKAGLDVIKFSIDSLDDIEAKEIRGKQNNFTQAYDKIVELLELKKSQNLQTRVVCTMLNLSTNKESLQKQKRFIELFKGMDVFAYVKSLDNRWYNDLDEDLQNKSHYESQYCEFPWTSLTVMSNGNVVPCTQDYDAEMVFGNIRDMSLEEIWNGDRYKEFREWHISGDFPKGNKCNERCDLKKVYHYLGNS